MKKIAVFCALPPDRNTGMATVDLAAYLVIKRCALDAEITLYTYGKLGPNSYRTGELPYEYFDVRAYAQDYFASDYFIFWGDFIHARSYCMDDRAMTQLEFSDYARYVFLSELPLTRLRDVMVFGGTIITNNNVDYKDAAYDQYFTKFFTHAGSVYFRDTLSAANIAHLRPGKENLGCDAAFLLQNEDLKCIGGFEAAQERVGVGVFFAASPSRLRRIFFAFLLARALNEKCIWIPWFKYSVGKSRKNFVVGKRCHRWPMMLLGLRITSGDTGIETILSTLDACKYVVSDTYHVCVNAWRMGIPAICVGQKTAVSNDSLGDKKKEVLYDMLGARAFYFFVKKLGLPFGIYRQAKCAAKTLADTNDTRRVIAHVTQERTAMLQHLQDELQRILQ